MFFTETLLGLRRPCGSDNVAVNEAGTTGALMGHVMGEAARKQTSNIPGTCTGGRCRRSVGGSCPVSWDAQGQSHQEGQCWGGSEPKDGQLEKQCPRQRVRRPWRRSWPSWSRSRKTQVKEEERSSCGDPGFSVSQMGAAEGLGVEQDPFSVCVENRL